MYLIHVEVPLFSQLLLHCWQAESCDGPAVKQCENSDSLIILVRSHLRTLNWVGTSEMQRFQLIKTLSYH